MKNLEISDLQYSQGNWSGTFNGFFQEDRWHLLCGKSGSGKSTLLRLLSGLATPTGGQILLDGTPIHEIAPSKRNINFMSQTNFLIPHHSVKENLDLIYHSISDSSYRYEDRLNDLLSAFDLDRSQLTRRPFELSGGQLSRFNLLRALLKPCKWLLLDEPFAAVDRQTRFQILSRLENLQKKEHFGVLLVSHDLDDLHILNPSITVISQGSIVEQSNLQDAITHPKHWETALMMRSGLFLKLHEQDFFVCSEKLKTNEDFPASIPSDYIKHQFQNGKQLRTGKVVRIIDMDSPSDILISMTEKFDGNVFYRIEDLVPIQQDESYPV